MNFSISGPAAWSVTEVEPANTIFLRKIKWEAWVLEGFWRGFERKVRFEDGLRTQLKSRSMILVVIRATPLGQSHVFFGEGDWCLKRGRGVPTLGSVVQDCSPRDATGGSHTQLKSDPRRRRQWSRTSAGSMSVLVKEKALKLEGCESL